ncbi:MAG: ATP synthase F0 subunit B [Lentisphaerae bacterium GWF2_57_35]|nr:MAG: ATP synthase F0 subunit B [Lentisphaerae bacterium GWF2_57_35]
MNAELTTTQAVVEVKTASTPQGMHHTVMDISGEMVLLTWLMFTVTAFILYKIAWKPILAALDKRENDIKASLDTADKARQQAEDTKIQCERLLQEADAQARELIEQARKTAQETSDSMRNQAREESRLLLVSAQQEIAFEKEKAVNALRQESAQLAIELAGKLIKKNLDTEQNRALTGQWLSKL